MIRNRTADPIKTVHILGALHFHFRTLGRHTISANDAPPPRLLSSGDVYLADVCDPNPCGDNSVCLSLEDILFPYALCTCEDGYEDTGSTGLPGDTTCIPIGEWFARGCPSEL